MKLIGGLSSGKWNNNTKKQGTKKVLEHKQKKIQIKMGKPTKGMRENN